VSFGQKTGTVPKLFANPVLTQVKKPKLGKLYAESQPVEDGGNEILKISADCHGSA